MIVCSLWFTASPTSSLFPPCRTICPILVLRPWLAAPLLLVLRLAEFPRWSSWSYREPGAGRELDRAEECDSGLIEKPDILKKMSLNSRRIAEAEYSLETQARRYVQLYEEMILR